MLTEFNLNGYEILSEFDEAREQRRLAFLLTQKIQLIRAHCTKHTKQSESLLTAKRIAATRKALCKIARHVPKGGVQQLQADNHELDTNIQEFAESHIEADMSTFADLAILHNLEMESLDGLTPHGQRVLCWLSGNIPKDKQYVKHHEPLKLQSPVNPPAIVQTANICGAFHDQVSSVFNYHLDDRSTSAALYLLLENRGQFVSSATMQSRASYTPAGIRRAVGNLTNYVARGCIERRIHNQEYAWKYEESPQTKRKKLVSKEVH